MNGGLANESAAAETETPKAVAMGQNLNHIIVCDAETAAEIKDLEIPRD
jgi:chromosome segregation ATPase